jgi:shikimate dehydrogenase
MYGYVRSLREAGCNPAGMKVLLLGAGGGARSVGFGLAEAGAAMIAVSARNQERAEAFAADLRLGGSIRTWVGTIGWQDESFAEACAEADLIVNTTPVGMAHTPAEHESPVAADMIRAGVWVSDLVYNPLETPLLALARQVGARPVGGLDMLVYQAAESIRYWTGLDAPVEVMKAAGLERLSAPAAPAPEPQE